MARQLDKLVEIQRRSTAQDSAGQQQDVWTKVGTAWASIRPVSTREQRVASGPRADVTHEIVVRHGPEIRSEDRLVHGTPSRIFDVKGPPANIDEHNRYLKLMGVEHAD